MQPVDYRHFHIDQWILAARDARSAVIHRFLRSAFVLLVGAARKLMRTTRGTVADETRAVGTDVTSARFRKVPPQGGVA